MCDNEGRSVGALIGRVVCDNVGRSVGLLIGRVLCDIEGRSVGALIGWMSILRKPSFKLIRMSRKGRWSVELAMVNLMVG